MDGGAQDDVLSLMPTRQGHFRYESGHHGELWLDLELLYLHPEPVNQLADALAGRLARLRPEAVCGPLVEGAFVALTVAADLEVPFLYSERIETPGAEGLFPVRYALPRVQRELVRGKRVAIVNDVINAGSAVIGAFTDLVSAGAQPVAIGSLLVLGPLIARFAQEQGVALEALAWLPFTIWTPDECPLCAQGIPLSER